MTEWAVRFEPQRVHDLAKLRGLASVEACAVDDVVWIRVAAGDAVDSVVAALPGQRFRVLDDGQLVAAGERVPRGWLPDGDWKPVTDFIEVSLPTAKFGGLAPPQIRLELVRNSSTAARQATGLLTDFASWTRFIDSAAEVRIRCLRFAIAGDKRVLVMGEPLPSLPGTYLTVSQGVAVPAGTTWAPPVDAATVRRVFAVADDSLVLWTRSDTWETIPSDAIVNATRAAARAMLGEPTAEPG